MHEALKRSIKLVRHAAAPQLGALRGDLYEELSLWALHKKLEPLGSQSLHRVGKSGDRGLDSVGNWNQMDSLVQCKSGKSKITGAIWRDLSGVGLRSTQNCRTPAIVALVSPMPMTHAGLVEFMSSDQALMHFSMPWSPQSLRTGEIDSNPLKSTVTNPAAEHILAERKIRNLSGLFS